MGLTRSEQDAQLAELYARIPRFPWRSGSRALRADISPPDRNRDRNRESDLDLSRIA